ncbi:MAG TPA: hypothetical protein VKR31_15275 [Rhizomicrobium sp.]|nr:hypothetical protein [Rhizomicrobium sp.]
MKPAAMMLSVATVTLLAGSPAMAMDTAQGILFAIVQIPNSQSTNVFGINDVGSSGVITGSWTDPSAVEHGYFGPVSGSNYVTFDDPNSPGPGTEPRGINDNGYITGFSNSQNGSLSGDVPFERDPSGTITEIKKGGALLNAFVQGINKKNEFTGGYINASLQSVGYLGESGAYKKAVKLTGLANTGYAARGINNKGDVVGWYYDPSGVQHGFVISGGTAQKLDPAEPNMASNVLEGINDKGKITGFWTDTAGVIHGYVYSSDKKQFHALKVPGAVSFVQAWGISNKGAIAISSDAGYYVYYPPNYPTRVHAHGSYKLRVKPKPQLP